MKTNLLSYNAKTAEKAPYVVLDLEWNQPYTPKLTVTKPIKLVGEIVQIGAVKLDQCFHVVDTFKIFVKPKYYTKMHHKVRKITNIRTTDLQYGFPFERALNYFKKWCGENFSFITWGEDDVEMLRDNMVLHGLDSSWLPIFYNLQPIYGKQICKSKRIASLGEAVKNLNIVEEIAHDALNDALSAARICSVLDMSLGLEQYEACSKFREKHEDEIAWLLLSNHFKTSKDVLSDDESLSFIRDTCGSAACFSEWAKQNQYKMVTIVKSGKKEFFIRIKCRKNGDETLRAGITIYRSNEQYLSYYEKLLEKQEGKKERAQQYALAAGVG